MDVIEWFAMENHTGIYPNQRKSMRISALLVAISHLNFKFIPLVASYAEWGPATKVMLISKACYGGLSRFRASKMVGSITIFQHNIFVC